MTAIKERIIGAVSIMSDKDAEKVWNLIQSAFALGDIENVEPDEDEIAAMKAYYDGDADYQPLLTHDELLKELDI